MRRWRSVYFAQHCKRDESHKACRHVTRGARAEESRNRIACARRIGPPDARSSSDLARLALTRFSHRHALGGDIQVVLAYLADAHDRRRCQALHARLYGAASYKRTLEHRPFRLD